MRTKEEITKQIEGLKLMKEKLPEFSFFGDNNWEQIDAQLDILELTKEPGDFYIDETSEEFEDGNNGVYNEAEKAEQWLNGEIDEDLFE